MIKFLKCIGILLLISMTYLAGAYVLPWDARKYLYFSKDQRERGDHDHACFAQFKTAGVGLDNCLAERP